MKMDNDNTTIPPIKEESQALSFRKNSACWAMHTSLLAMAGEFDLNMVLQIVRVFAQANGVDLGNEVRTARHVIQQMLAAGQLVRPEGSRGLVKRGRWTVKK